MTTYTYNSTNSKQCAQDGVATYSGARDATTSAVYTLVSGVNNVLHNSFLGGLYYVRRGDLQFDTSALGDGVTILSATLRMRATATNGANADSDTLVALDNTNNANLSSTLASEDMDDFTSVSIGSKALSAYTNTGVDVDLDLTDFGVINKTGTTRIGLRLQGDIDNSTPTGSNILRIDTSVTCDLIITYTWGDDIKNHSTLTTSLVSYWDMEEASGKRYDLHGSNDLDDFDTVTQATGKIGNGADFVAAETEWFETPGDIGSTNAFSISLWVNPDRVNVNEAIYHKCDTTNSDTSGAEMRLLMLSAGTFQWSIGDGTSYAINRSISHGMSAGTWYHIVVTWDGTDATLYKNGSVLDSETNAFTRKQSSEPLNIGRRERGAVPDLYFDGQLDEIGFWDKALTSTEVTNLYNSGSGLPYYSPDDVKNDTTLSTSLVSYWELEEASGTRTDSHGSNDLVETNTPGQVVGIQGNAADFDGTVGEALSTSSGTGFTMTNAASFSIAGWFKPNNAVTGATLFARWAGTSKGFLVRQNASDQVEAYVGDGSTTRGVVTGSTDIDDTNWHHVVFVWDATTDKQSIYVDGVLDATIGSAQTISQSTAEIQIGDDTQATFGANYNGAVDEMAAYTKALSVGEIRALYGYGAPPVYDAGGATPTLYNALALCNF